MRLHNTSDPSHPIDRMLLHMLSGEYEEGRKISRELDRLGYDNIPLPGNADPRDPKARQDTWIRHTFNKGWFTLNEGRYSEGMQYLEAGRFIGVYGGDRLVTTAPIYDPQQHDIRGKSIIVNAEGGLGDEMIHARFGKLLKDKGAAKVYYIADPSLHSIMSRIDGIDGLYTRNEISKVAHDYWVPGFSAGWVAGAEFDNFPSKPYITVSENSKAVWANFFNTDKRVKVGIRWAGNPKFEHQQFRKFAPQFLTQMSMYDDVQLYSFQRDHNVINLPDNIVDLQHALISWEDTLAAIDNMDIMVTSCTSVAHAAAAMGKETWVMVPCLPYHTWALGAPESQDTPYYDCVRVYRKESKDCWNSAFQKMYRDFEEKFDLPHVEMGDWDRAQKSLNMQCGPNKIPGALNVDSSKFYSSDLQFNFNSGEWPWEDNTFDYIYAFDVMNQLGTGGVQFTDVIKEMYRVSRDGALWEVKVPHPRCDLFHSNPLGARSITEDTFRNFDKQWCLGAAQKKIRLPLLAFEHEVDLEVVDVKYDNITPIYGDRMKAGEIKPEDLARDAVFSSNVVESITMMVQVHKPGRISVGMLQQALTEAEANL